MYVLSSSLIDDASQGVAAFRHFLHNHPADFIEQCWHASSDNPAHFRQKFDRYLKASKSSSLAILQLHAELDDKNSGKFNKYVALWYLNQQKIQKIYQLTLRHDHGKWSVKALGSSEEDVKRWVCKAERAPVSAVVSCQQVFW